MINIVGSFLCIFFTIIPIYKFITLRQNINSCWSKIKCTPIGQILHPLFGPKNISMSQNAAICDSGKFNSMFDSKISKIEGNMYNFEKVVGNIKGDILTFRQNMNDIKKETINKFKMVGEKIGGVFVKVSKLFVHMINIIKRILGAFKYLIQMGTSVYYSISSIWNGPIFELSRSFAGMG